MVSDSAQTGFGRVGRELARRFVAAGVDLRMLAVNWRGREGEVVGLLRSNPQADVGAFLAEFDADPLNRLMVPAITGGDMMGNAITGKAIDGSLFTDHWRPEKVLVVADPRAMSERLDLNRAALESLPVYNYVPIEGAPLPKAWQALWTHVQPIAMSTYGQGLLQGLLGRDVAMVPHGVSDAFFPISPRNPATLGGQPIRTKAEAKTAFGLDGKTVFLRTDRFVPRKNYPALFRTMAPVLDEDPSRELVIHCHPVDEGGTMAELVSLLPGAFEISMKWRHPQVRFTGGHDTYRGYPDAMLNVLYNAADVYVSPTMSEGWGLTLAEAAATGVPVVTTDYAAGPETVGPGGVLVQPTAYWTNTQGHDWALVDEGAFTAATLRLANDPAERDRIGRAGSEYVTRFTWDAAASAFLSAMA